MFTTDEIAFVTFLVHPWRICVCLDGKSWRTARHSPLDGSIIWTARDLRLVSHQHHCHLVNESRSSHNLIGWERTKRCILYQRKIFEMKRCHVFFNCCCPSMFFVCNATRLGDSIVGPPRSACLGWAVSIVTIQYHHRIELPWHRCWLPTFSLFLFFVLFL